MTANKTIPELEGRCQKYLQQIRDGVGLTDEDILDYQQTRRELYHLKHKERMEARRVTFRRGSGLETQLPPSSFMRRYWNNQRGAL